MLLGEFGVLTPIEDYVLDPEKTPFFHALPENMQAEMLAVMKQPDGHIYGFAEYTSNPSANNPEKMWINSAWLEKLEIEVPTTTEELKNVLIAFRDGDPNGNGIQDEIGVYGRRQGWGEDIIACLMNSFVATSWNNGKYNGGLACDQDSLGIIRMGRGVYGVDWTDDPEVLKTTSSVYLEAGIIEELTYAQLNKRPDQHNWNWAGFGAGAPEKGNIWSTGANLYDGEYSIETAPDAWMIYFLAAVDDPQYRPKTLPVLNYTTKEIDSLSDIRSNVVSYVNSFLAECTTGVQDVEKNWDAYVAEIEKLGLQTWLDLAQEVYDRQR